MVSSRNLNWSMTFSYLDISSAECRSVLVNTSLAPSKSDILVDVEPGLIANIYAMFPDYLAVKAARAMEFNLVSMLSARLESTQGAMAPATMAACFTPLHSCELTL